MSDLSKQIKGFVDIAGNDLSISEDEEFLILKINEDVDEEKMGELDLNRNGSISLGEWLKYKKFSDHVNAAEVITANGLWQKIEVKGSHDEVDKIETLLIVSSLVLWYLPEEKVKASTVEMQSKVASLFDNYNSWFSNLSKLGLQDYEIKEIILSKPGLIFSKITDLSFNLYLQGLELLGIRNNKEQLKTTLQIIDFEQRKIELNDLFYNYYYDVLELTSLEFYELNDLKKFMAPELICSGVSYSTSIPELIKYLEPDELNFILLELIRTKAPTNMSIFTSEIVDIIVAFNEFGFEDSYIKNYIIKASGNENMVLYADANTLTYLHDLFPDKRNFEIRDLFIMLAKKTSDDFCIRGYDSKSAEWFRGLPLSFDEKIDLLCKMSAKRASLDCVFSVYNKLITIIDDKSRCLRIALNIQEIEDVSASNIEKVIDIINGMQVNAESKNPLNNIKAIIMLSPSADILEENVKLLRGMGYADFEILQLILDSCEQTSYVPINLNWCMNFTLKMISDLDIVLGKKDIELLMFEIIKSKLSAYVDYENKNPLSFADLNASMEAKIFNKLGAGGLAQFLLFVNNSENDITIENIDEAIELCIKAKEKYGLKYFGRYSFKILNSLFTAKRSRPLAFCFTPEYDWNGAFYFNYKSLEELIDKGYRLNLVEALWEGDVYNRLETFKDGEIKLMVLGLHGSKYSALYSMFDRLVTEEQELDESDDEWVEYTSKFAIGAHIILLSCSTGEGGAEDFNVFNMFKYWFRSRPDVRIFAPDRPTTPGIDFLADKSAVPEYAPTTVVVSNY